MGKALADCNLDAVAGNHVEERVHILRSDELESIATELIPQLSREDGNTAVRQIGAGTANLHHTTQHVNLDG